MINARLVCRYCSTQSIGFYISNGLTSKLGSPSHTYSNPGIYIATVMVKDANGDIDYETVTATVESIFPSSIWDNHFNFKSFDYLNISTPTVVLN